MIAILPIVMCSCTFGALAADPAPPSAGLPLSEEVDNLLLDLDSDEFATRTRAFVRLEELAAHSEARQLMAASIERAIRDSDLGVNPTDDGQLIRVALPELTEERRREYIKVAKHKAEEARVSIRNIRRHAKDALDRLARDGEVGEDDVVRAEKQLEVTTKTYVEAIDELLKHKESELLDV